MGKIKVGSIVTSGVGGNCYMGTVVAIFGRIATVKYVDFKEPRRVPLSHLRKVGS
jgi:hypothetical protein